MSTANNGIRSTIIPCLRYSNAHAAIAFLCDTFGFTKQLVVPGDDNSVVHAQLTLGNGLIMLGSTNSDTDFSRMMITLDKGAAIAHSVYVVVPDADAVYQRVRAAGMDILLEIKDEEYGGRGFTCRDPEQHIWSFGTYDPFGEKEHHVARSPL